MMQAGILKVMLRERDGTLKLVWGSQDANDTEYTEENIGKRGITAWIQKSPRGESTMATLEQIPSMGFMKGFTGIPKKPCSLSFLHALWKGRTPPIIFLFKEPEIKDRNP